MQAGATFPNITVPTLDGDTRSLFQPQGGADWQLVVVYRGLHCPLCKKYLATLENLAPAYRAAGVDVVAVSGDGAEKAQAMAEEVGLSIPVAFNLSVAQMAELGLFISDPRSPAETDQPFPEPGVYVINAEGHVQIVDRSNAPFARPDLQALLNGIKFVRDKDYPIRGMHAA